MIERFSPHFGRFYKNTEIFDQLVLPCKFADLGRANIVLELALYRRELILIAR
jgi:hypothetical protein